MVLQRLEAQKIVVVQNRLTNLLEPSKHLFLFLMIVAFTALRINFFTINLFLWLCLSLLMLRNMMITEPQFTF